MTTPTRRCPASITFNLDPAQFGAKTVIESATAGWTLTNIVCTGDSEVVYGASRRLRRG